MVTSFLWSITIQPSFFRKIVMIFPIRATEAQDGGTSGTVTCPEPAGASTWRSREAFMIYLPFLSISGIPWHSKSMILRPDSTNMGMFGSCEMMITGGWFGTSLLFSPFSWGHVIIPTDELTPWFFRGLGLLPPTRGYIPFIGGMYDILGHIMTYYDK